MKKFPLLLILLVVLLAGVITTFYFLKNKQDLSVIKSFDDCVRAGYPVMESYPRQCKTKDGKHFVEKVDFKNGIYGKATLGPTCPVQRSGEECTKPYQGIIIVKSPDKSREISRFSTNKNGEFKVSLPPGNYYLASRESRSLPFLKEVFVKVEANKFTKIDLEFDTGIR